MNESKIKRYVNLTIVSLLLLGCSMFSYQHNEFEFSHTRPVGTEKDVQSTLTPTTTTEPPIMDAHPELEVISRQNVDRIALLNYFGKGEVRALAISDDGSTIAVGTSMGVTLIDVESKLQLAFLDSPLLINREAKVCDVLDQDSLAFSPDGKILAVAGENIQLWNLESYKLEKTIENQIEDKKTLITNIQFSNSGEQIVGMQIDRVGDIACYQTPRNFVIYGVEDGKLIFRRNFIRIGELPSHYLITHSDLVYFVMQSRNIESKRYEIAKVNIQTGQYLGSSYRSDVVNRLSITENTYIQYEHDYWADQSTSKIIDLRTGKIQQEMNEHVKVLPGSTNLIFYSDYLRWVTDASGVELCRFGEGINLGMGYFDQNAFSRDGNKAVVRLSKDGEIHVLAIDTCTISEPVAEFPSAAYLFDFSPDGKRTFVNSWMGGYYQVDEANGEYQYISSARSIVFPVDNDHLYALTMDDAILANSNLIKVFDLNTKDISKSVNTLWTGASDMQQSKDTSTLVFIEKGQRTREFTFTRNGLEDVVITVDEIDGYALHADGSKLMTWNNGSKEIMVYNTVSGEAESGYPIRIPVGHSVKTVSDDFSYMITNCGEGMCKLELPDLKSLVIFPDPHEGTIITNAVQNLFSKDNDMYITSASKPDSLLFWDLQTGELLQQVPLFQNTRFFFYVPSFAINPDGKVIYVADDAGNIQLWGVRK